MARNGPEFEQRIQQNEQNNPKFNFLKPGDPYNAYFKHKVRDFQEAKEKGTTIVPPSAQTTSSQSSSSSSAATSAVGSSQQTNKQLESLIEAPIIIRDPPPDYKFSAEPPTLAAMDLELVKLTAQFVAVHGRSFLNNLMAKESRNYQFDFVRPQHGLFSYFTQLIEQYAKVLMPPDTIVDDLKKEIERDKAILDKVRYRVEWNKIREAERRREEEEAERERVQYAQIDWHDFTIVETVDYQSHERGTGLPLPTTPEQVGSRILLQQRMLEGTGEQTMEMEVDSDEEAENAAANAAGKSNGKSEEIPAEEPIMPPPLPPSLDNVVIKKDYNPKAAKAAASTAKVPEAWVISPVTGEKIPADKLQEHMRYGLLDSRWIEERERSLQEKMTQEEVYAPGTAIESSLKQLAERRTDIFGSGTEETEIGRKIGEEAKKVPEKVTWDGHSNSAQRTIQAAQSKITVEQQIEEIRRRTNPDPEKEKIGPAVIPSSTSSSSSSNAPLLPSNSSNMPPHHHHQGRMNHLPPHPLPGQHHLGPPGLHHMMNKPPLHHMRHPPPLAPMGQQQQQILIPSASGAFMMPAPQVPLAMGLYGLPPAGDGSLLSHPLPGMHLQPPPPPNFPPSMPPPIPMPTAAPSIPDEPAAKKQKTEDSLIPEDEFLQQNSLSVTLRVAVPLANDKDEWNLKGQTLALTLDLTESISTVKQKIHEATGLPPGKQKLSYEGIFVKDSNSLAYYNVTQGSVIQLQLKERGGRKK